MRATCRLKTTCLRPSGFTLVELLIVITIIMALAALVVPGIQRALEMARDTQCRHQLRQMVLGATLYATDNKGHMPPSYQREFEAGVERTWEWFLWEMGTDFQIQQCPSFRGAANWEGDRYTGYNYNASYVGGLVFIRNGQSLPATRPSAQWAQIKGPSTTALFGDGEYAGGANKFMRSPFPGALDSDAGLALGGTQGFRHRGRTNAGFADGRVDSLEVRHLETAAFGQPAPGTGFLSADNRLYNLE